MGNNIDKIKNSLQVSQKIFAGLDDYRLVGSILVAAINKEPHRELHDIDLLIDINIYDEVSHRFEQLEFKKITKYAPGFKWDEFERENYLTFGVLLIGEFSEEFFEYKPNRYLSLRINNSYLSPTMYELFGVKIRGIPLKSVYEGIRIANLNSKRRTDKQIVERKILSTSLKGVSLNDAFHVQILGLNIPYLYTFFSIMYNLIGGARLVLGRSYDPWK